MSPSDDFPSTVWEDLQKAGDPAGPGSRDAWNDLAEAYWQPVYHFIRTAWKKGHDDALDLTQEFFLTIFDPSFLARGDPNRGSFRAFVLTSLRNFLSNTERDRKRIKRGGGAVTLSLDFKTPDGDTLPLPAAPGEPPEIHFERAWARSVLDQSAETLKLRYEKENREKAWAAFRAYCLSGESPPSYREIAARLEVTPKDVDNFIYAARREFRSIVADTVRSTLSNPSDLEEELARLFGK